MSGLRHMEQIYRLYLTCPPHRNGFQGWLDEQEVIEIPDDSMDVDGASTAPESSETSDDEFVHQQPVLPMQDEGPPESFLTAYGVMFAHLNSLTLKHAMAGRCVHYDDCPALQTIQSLRSATTCSSCVHVVTETTQLYLHEDVLHRDPDCRALRTNNDAGHAALRARTFVLCQRCLRRNGFWPR